MQQPEVGTSRIDSGETFPMTPTVSVVIPTYDRLDKVTRAIKSALSQTSADLEVIVVDDGSSDGTEQALHQTFADRIRYFYQTNQGVSVARNKGIEEAKGEWVAFLDSDDVWESDKLECQLRALKQYGENCSACYTDVRFFNHSETRTMFQIADQSYRHKYGMGVNTDMLRLLVRPGGAGMVICLSSFMARKALIREIGGFDIALLYSQDSEFMFRLGMRTNFCYVNRPLVQFDRSPAEDRHVGVSSAWNQLDFFLKDSQLRLERLLGLTKGQPAAIRNLVRRQLGSIHNGWVNYYLETGDYGEARRAASRAAQLSFTPNIVAKWLLTRISPRLALRTVRRRASQKASAFRV